MLILAVFSSTVKTSLGRQLSAGGVKVTVNSHFHICHFSLDHGRCQYFVQWTWLRSGFPLFTPPSVQGSINWICRHDSSCHLGIQMGHSSLEPRLIFTPVRLFSTQTRELRCIGPSKYRYQLYHSSRQLAQVEYLPSCWPFVVGSRETFLFGFFGFSVSNQQSTMLRSVCHYTKICHYTKTKHFYI